MKQKNERSDQGREEGGGLYACYLCRQSVGSSHDLPPPLEDCIMSLVGGHLFLRFNLKRFSWLMTHRQRELYSISDICFYSYMKLLKPFRQADLPRALLITFKSRGGIVADATRGVCFLRVRCSSYKIERHTTNATCVIGLANCKAGTQSV